MTERSDAMELIRKFGRAGGKKLAKARGRDYYVKIGKRGARVKKRKAKQKRAMPERW
ncbi:MAG: hypothetical protein WB716_08580 [Candidatus Acidiferrales bacterium]